MVRSESKTSIIYLVGMPGSGKTTIGRQLAFKLGYEFVDLDLEIEKIASLSISDIFKEKGETYFRELEREIVKDSSQYQKTVIATGGGAPCFFDNIQVMNANGTTIFIDVSAEELCNRIWGNGQSNRPMLQNKTKNELLEEIRKKISSRMGFYELADYTIESDSTTAQELFFLLQEIK